MCAQKKYTSWLLPKESQHFFAQCRWVQTTKLSPSPKTFWHIKRCMIQAKAMKPNRERSLKQQLGFYITNVFCGLRLGLATWNEAMCPRRRLFLQIDVFLLLFSFAWHESGFTASLSFQAFIQISWKEMKQITPKNTADRYWTKLRTITPTTVMPFLNYIVPDLKMILQKILMPKVRVEYNEVAYL